MRTFIRALSVSAAFIAALIIVFPLLSSNEKLAYDDAAKGMAKGKFTEVNGRRVHYIEKGEGKPLILIHGFLYHTVMWKKSIDELAKKYRVLAIDLWGWGYSERLDPKEYSFALYGSQVAEFMRKLGIPRAVLVGQSMGGGISVYVAAHRPELVSALILVGPAVIPYSSTITAKVYQLPFVGEFLNSIPGDSLMRKNLRDLWFYNKYLVTGEYADEVLQPLRIRGTMAGAMHILRNVLKEPFVEKEAVTLAGLNKPVLIVHGREDRAIPLERSERLNALWKGSRLTVFARAGHTPHEEHPEKFNALALEFLSGLR